MSNDIFPNRCLAERHFPESSFSWTSFLRIVVQPNVIFPKHHLPKRRFAEIVWSKMSFHRTLNRPPAYVLVGERLSNICVISNWVRVWTCLNMDTVRIRKVENSRYGRFDLRACEIPRSVSKTVNNFFHDCQAQNCRVMVKLDVKSSAWYWHFSGY